ncbi:MAG TPA: PEP-CTERM sorting domain-containing protein [Planctomycetota bacterium]|nr:PEP-CTERM sorting domain-containing protein [Planctomycetota bacterium]
MKKCQMIFALAVVVALASGAAATPILYVSSTTVPSNFGPVGGTFGIGVLTLNGVRPVVVCYVGQEPIVHEGVSFFLQTSLIEHTSANGVAGGRFEGGSIVLKDSQDNDLLVGSVNNIYLQEVADGGTFTTLAAVGYFTVESGSLADDFGPHGSVVDLIFEFDPGAIDNLLQPFAGYSDVTLSPMIPEPVTTAILGLGLLGLVARRRRK